MVVSVKFLAERDRHSKIDLMHTRDERSNAFLALKQDGAEYSDIARGLKERSN